jgi:hypothetical protein
VQREAKREWLGRHVWICAADNSKHYGRVCSVDHRAAPLASVMIRLDGYRGAVRVEETARGVKWGFTAEE